MLQHRRHDVLRHGAPVPCSSSSSRSACTIHQAAAAWAWFEHSGSTCITPRKAQGLISARRLKSTTISVPDRPSRFRQENILRHSTVHLYSCQSAPDPASCAEDFNRRRRHSFHNSDLTESFSLMTYSDQRLSSSCRISAHNSSSFNIVDNADQKQVDDEEGAGNTSFKDGASSLLDEFEVEAVRRQLHHHFSSHGSISCRASSARSAKLCQEAHQAQNAEDHDHPQAHLKHRRNYAKWSEAGPQPSPDSEHHHTINGVVHWLLHLRIKTTSSHSTSASGRPVLCSSIATANSIIDYHHDPASPKGSRTVTPSRETTKRQLQDAIHDWSPNRPYHSDAVYFKAFHESLGGRTLAHKSAMLDQNMHADNQLKEYMDDKVLGRKGHNHFDKHHHIHHFHHHYHHVDYERQDELRLQDYQVINKDGLHVRHRSKLHGVHREELMICPDHKQRH